MTNALYARMQATANRLLVKYGQSGTIRRLTPPDPVEGGDPVETEYPATLVPMAYEAREIDGTVILAGDVKIYISSVGLAITPQPGDLVTANGKMFRIINGDPNCYDGVTNVVHIVQGRIAA
ncbi:hypothetical protein NAC44_11965 [Allorhizobium sp. BGMRC 0089]|uniref:hypothetical protein n=1 Tax=Allorhizobium sonneratiae TaxID=2934936 RepID=UPI0020345FA4|nr:hypothetical protein [Allorhizobium sonneratiae]MCM2293038.1 hypothetical protein [Allorhizobium sonneratiae]